jgi:uncharacterized membrane protein
MAMWIIGGFILLLLLSGLILLGFLLYGTSRRESSGVGLEPPTQPENALQIVEQRYAQGEIDQEEYQRIRTDLEEAERRREARRDAAPPTGA